MVLEINHHRMQLLVSETCRTELASLDIASATIPVHPPYKGEGL